MSVVANCVYSNVERLLWMETSELAQMSSVRFDRSDTVRLERLALKKFTAPLGLM